MSGPMIVVDGEGFLGPPRANTRLPTTRRATRRFLLQSSFIIVNQMPNQIKMIRFYQYLR
jgi:hypothetical protein